MDRMLDAIGPLTHSKEQTMVLDNRQVVTLAYRGLITMQLAAGARIQCTDGRIWLTQDGSPGDVVLESGECFETCRRGALVVQALRGATFSVRDPALAPPAPRLPGRLAKAFGAARATTAPAASPA
jgi:hypothetical protein